MAVDPWKNRSVGMMCKTCIWFVPKETKMAFDQEQESTPNNVGRCRKRAPTMDGYPVVFTNDWCGDHKLDENSI